MTRSINLRLTSEQDQALKDKALNAGNSVSAILHDALAAFAASPGDVTPGKPAEDADTTLRIFEASENEDAVITNARRAGNQKLSPSEQFPLSSADVVKTALTLYLG